MSGARWCLGRGLHLDSTLPVDIVEKVGFRLGLCCWGGFLKHSIAGDVNADTTETRLAVSGK
jgi:hypothetical protein